MKRSTGSSISLMQAVNQASLASTRQYKEIYIFAVAVYLLEGKRAAIPSPQTTALHHSLVKRPQTVDTEMQGRSSSHAALPSCLCTTLHSLWNGHAWGRMGESINTHPLWHLKIYGDLQQETGGRGSTCVKRRLILIKKKMVREKDNERRELGGGLQEQLWLEVRAQDERLHARKQGRLRTRKTKQGLCKSSSQRSLL